MKTHFKIQRTFFSAAKKYAFPIALIATAAIGAAAQTQTNTFPLDGNAGAGTTAPTQKLQVDGAGLFTGSSLSGNTAAGVYIFDQNIASLNGSNGRDLNIQAQSLKFFTGTSYSEKMRINANGNVGIGTTSPQSLLHLYSTVNSAHASGIYIDAQGTGNLQQAMLNFVTLGDGTKAAVVTGTKGWHLTARGNAFVNSGEQNDLQLYSWDGGTVNIAQYWDSVTGHIGIGTMAPTSTITWGGLGGKIIDISGISADAGTSSGVVVHSGNGGLEAAFGLSGNNGGFYLDVAGHSDATKNFIAFRTEETNTQSSPTERMRITKSGNVGIGTTSPGSEFKLDVAGNINSSGTITGNNIVAKYQDLAEWVPSSEQLTAGTVVVLDTSKSNQVISSTQSYDTRVAGVISAQPGIALGERGEGKVLVATTGRVRVKVDASRGPIQIGDLLVTSDVPSVAMKSEPVNLGGVQIHRPGTIIGKALEPLAKGKGEILVLLSLQ